LHLTTPGAALQAAGKTAGIGRPNGWKTDAIPYHVIKNLIESNP
jgi:hypothetical protein